MTPAAEQQERLREVEQLFRMAMDGVGLSLFDWNVSTGAVHLSGCWTEVFGAVPTPTQTTMEALAALVAEEDKDRLRRYVVDVLKEEPASLPIEYRIRSSAGDWRWMRSHGAVIARDFSGRAARVACFSTDITQRKGDEARLLQMTRTLDQQASQLGTLNVELEALRYALSHDLRAPLRHLDGFMGMFRKRADAKLDEESLRLLDKMSDASGRLGHLIYDLLPYLQDAVVEMRVSEVALTPMVKDIIEGLAPEIGDRPIDWVLSELPVVRGDRALLHRALHNLIQNALKFTRRRSLVRIAIDWKEEGQNTVLCITDNGEGFDMKHAHKLFKVFRRLHPAKDFEGSGVGLASVIRIAARHGGKAWAVGIKGQGASFFVSIPKQT